MDEHSNWMDDKTAEDALSALQSEDYDDYLDSLDYDLDMEAEIEAMEREAREWGAL